jgi:uroporphyrinogen-III synthase
MTRLVVVTRDEDADGPLSRALSARGLRVARWRTVRTAPPEDAGPLEAALAELASFDWLVFTSRRAVAAVAERVRPLPAGLRIAAVGEASSAALEREGWPVDVLPEEQFAEGLVAALSAAGVGPGTRVLFPASEIARDAVPEGLAALGARVTTVVAYRTLATAPDADAVRDALDDAAVDVVTFASPSAVENLAAGLPAALLGRLRREARAVAIGPTTAEAVRAAGWAGVAMADRPSLDGLAETVAVLCGPHG